jgi:hypothetical protein
MTDMDKDKLANMRKPLSDEEMTELAEAQEVVWLNGVSCRLLRAQIEKLRGLIRETEASNDHLNQMIADFRHRGQANGQKLPEHKPVPLTGLPPEPEGEPQVKPGGGVPVKADGYSTDEQVKPGEGVGS